ncbi:MAG: acetate--CoA ligase family protein, partial [Halobacteriota archaeon]
PNVAVLTDGGGHATVTADAIERAGLTVPDLSDGTQATLGELYELSPNLTNPVDVMGMSDHETMWYDTAKIILEDPNVDALLITGAALGYEECWDESDPDRDLKIAKKVTTLVDDIEKPVIFNSMWEELDCATSLDYLAEHGVPVYERIDTSVAALKGLVDYGDHLANAEKKSDFELLSEGNTSPQVAAARENGRTSLSEYESKRLLADHGAPVTDFTLAETATDAVEQAAAFDGPVAMKVVSPDIVHKTEAGGVVLDVEGPDAVRDAYGRIMDAAAAYDSAAQLDGVLLSPMVPDGVELLVGVVDDPEIGPVITCGVGGTLVEAIDDVAFRALPVTEYDARTMLDEIQAQSLFEGPRDLPPVDRDELAEFLTVVSDIVTENPQISDLDVNPVVATTNGLAVVDATIELKSP